jgi:ferric-dicitrate binding protein FerR (iron transport regulator)
MTPRDKQPDAELDDIERLLRMAGPRELPSATRRDAARLAVRTAWRQTIRARTRRRWMLIGVPTMTAAAALVVATIAWWPAPTPPATDAIVAQVIAATGSLRVHRAASIAALAGGDSIRRGDIVETPSGVIAGFRLDGGGEIRQNAGTSLRWTAARRVALVDGHIYVDSGRPADSVLVSTPAGVVRDVGTRFDVRVREGEVRVRVREGAVHLDSAAASPDVIAGQELLARPGESVAVRPVSTFGDDWDWVLRGSIFHLEGATLSTLLTWAAAESGRPVEFRPRTLPAEIGATVLHGSIAGLSLEEVLDTVLPAAGLTHRLEDGRIVIQRIGRESRQ